MRRIITSLCTVLAITTLFTTRTLRADTDYNVGTPTVKEIWVDPVAGNDVNDGSSSTKALKTLNVAMAYVPSTTTFTTTGYRIMLMPGTYSSDVSPTSYMSYQGTAKFPLILMASGGPGTVFLPFMSVSDCQYFYLVGVNIVTASGADAFSASRCDHVYLKNCSIDGFNTSDSLISQNTAAFTGSKYCYIEDCSLKHSSGALLYMSASQYGHMLRCSLDSTTGTALNISSGSAYLYLERNQIRHAAQNGLLLGGVTYLDYDFTTPWLHYDVYDIRVDNNTFEHCKKEAFIASGCYDVLVAFNTFYDCGASADNLFVAGLGRRTCASDKSTCSDLISAGAWGTLHSYTTDDDAAWIPNKHLFIYNNLFYNPAGMQTAYAELGVWGPRKALAHATCPKPALADDDIQIKGNVIFNGALDKPLGLSDTSGCQDTNTICNKLTITTENTLNLKEPDLASAMFGDLHPSTGSFLLGATVYPAPDFTWNDLPGKPAEPQGELSNTISIDLEGSARTGSSNAPGAYVTPHADVPATVGTTFTISELSANPATASSSFVVTTTERSPFSVVLTDLLGRTVRTVVSMTADAGEHPVMIDANSLANGMYLIRIGAAGQIVTKRLVVAH